MPDLSKWLLVSDIDGTLVDRDYNCNPDNIEMINKFIEYGGKFGIATGRALKSAVNAAKIVKTSCPSIIYNGGAICDLNTEKIYWSSTVDKSGYECTKFVFENFPKASIEIHIDNDIYVARHSRLGDEHLLQAHTNIFEKDFYDIPKENWSKILFAAEFDEIDELIELTKPFVNNKCTYIRTNKQFYEILPREAEKGFALKKLAKMLNIEYDNICAIGDYYNDLTLIKSASFSACPSDSPTDVKSNADYICCSCADGAVADFIRKIIDKANNTRRLDNDG